MKYYPTSRRREHVWRAQMFDYALADRASETKAVKAVLDDPRAQEYCAAERLFQDTVLGLYKYRPEGKTPGEIAPSCRLNQAILDRVQGEPRWDELRGSTRLDEAMAILGAGALGARLLEVLTDEMKRQVQGAVEAEQEARRQQALADALADQAARGEGPPDAQNQIQQARDAAQEAMQRAEQAASQAVQGLQDNEAARRTIRKALRESTGEMQDQARKMAGWGLGAGQSVEVPPAERLALAAAIAESEKLRRIARLAGRFKNLALAAQAAKVPTGVGEIYGVELGNALGRVLPLELVKARHRVLRLDFLRRFGQAQLLQYRLRERERAAMGPIVAVWDESASMSGQKEVWAKAVALAILAIAQRQRRPWAGVGFSAGHVDPVKHPQGLDRAVRVVAFPRPHLQVKPSDLVTLAKHFFRGGTDFELALDAAREVIGEQAYRRADIIFITDGIARLSDEYLAGLLRWKEHTGARIFTVLVDVGQATPEGIKAWSDRVENVSGLADDVRRQEAAARTVFGEV
jgi:uncharacterized protein with von Willebrand factor type A (vWA) domain